MAALPDLTLASASPRRAELLALTDWSFNRCATSSDESQVPGENPRALALRLANTKAQAARKICDPTSLILAADTLVVSNGKVLGKPKDGQAATQMLEELRGCEHTVITAIALQPHVGSEIELELCETEVPMRAYSDAEIHNYVTGGSPFDKAGAYGIQDESFKPADVASMSGCYANVMGLPLCHLARAMRSLGFIASTDIPQACMNYTGYDCHVYSRIEKGEL